MTTTKTTETRLISCWYKQGQAKIILKDEQGHFVPAKGLFAWLQNGFYGECITEGHAEFAQEVQEWCQLNSISAEYKTDDKNGTALLVHLKGDEEKAAFKLCFGEYIR